MLEQCCLSLGTTVGRGTSFLANINQTSKSFQKLLNHGLPCVNLDSTFTLLVGPFTDSAKPFSTFVYIIFSSPTTTTSTGDKLGNYKFKSPHGLSQLQFSRLRLLPLRLRGSHFIRILEMPHFQGRTILRISLLTLCSFNQRDSTAGVGTKFAHLRKRWLNTNPCSLEQLAKL